MAFDWRVLPWLLFRTLGHQSRFCHPPSPPSRTFPAPKGLETPFKAATPCVHSSLVTSILKSPPHPPSGPLIRSCQMFLVANIFQEKGEMFGEEALVVNLATTAAAIAEGAVSCVGMDRATFTEVRERMLAADPTNVRLRVRNTGRSPHFAEFSPRSSRTEAFLSFQRDSKTRAPLRPYFFNADTILGSKNYPDHQKIRLRKIWRCEHVHR